jgi:hypothetical protein
MSQSVFGTFPNARLARPLGGKETLSIHTLSKEITGVTLRCQTTRLALRLKLPLGYHWDAVADSESFVLQILLGQLFLFPGKRAARARWLAGFPPARRGDDRQQAKKSRPRWLAISFYITLRWSVRRLTDQRQAFITGVSWTQNIRNDQPSLWRSFLSNGAVIDRNHLCYSWGG